MRLANAIALYSLCVQGCFPYATQHRRGPNQETHGAPFFQDAQAGPHHSIATTFEASWHIPREFAVLDCLSEDTLLLLIQVSSASLVSNAAGDGRNFQSVLTGSTGYASFQLSEVAARCQNAG
jgi:hypothetical protein